MSSRVLAGLLAAGCVTAAAGGAYVAVRQNAATPVPVAAAPAYPAEPAARPVSETEAVVAPPEASAPATAPSHAQPAATPTAKELPAAREIPKPVREARRAPAPAVRRSPVAESPRAPAQPPPSAAAPSTAATSSQPAPAATSWPVEAAPQPTRVPDPLPSRPAEPQFEEVTLPTSSVIGLEIDTPVTSERARLEDRVDAKVTRDVIEGGRVAIPAGSRVIGAVTLVERGGKVKQAARLGVRFHTLILGDGREVPLSTEPVYREGESPAGDSARKIGGAAIGGAILGAIIGGGKGAMIGGATGAAGGSAVVMAGDRNAATLAPGTVVTVRLSEPAAIDVEKRDQQ